MDGEGRLAGVVNEQPGIFELGSSAEMVGRESGNGHFPSG